MSDRRGSEPMDAEASAGEKARTGIVCKLDRKFPMIGFEDGSRMRCELAASMKKNRGSRDSGQLTIGDQVAVVVPEGHDVGMIERVLPRRSEFLRRDPVDRAQSQSLAANFDRVLIMHPIDRLNSKRLERELVLAHSTGTDVVVVLTKKDLLPADEAMERFTMAADLAGDIVEVMAISVKDPLSIGALRRKMTDGSISIMIGSSGAGKSTLVNALLGRDVQATTEVREGDGKGRHTTVSREMIELPPLADDPSAVANREAAYLVDMPGVRGLGLWDSLEGVETAFPDVMEYVEDCRFRDCRHENEPGCAVLAAVESGRLNPVRVKSYRSMVSEIEDMEERRVRSSWRN